MWDTTMYQEKMHCQPTVTRFSSPLPSVLVTMSFKNEMKLDILFKYLNILKINQQLNYVQYNFHLKHRLPV